MNITAISFTISFILALIITWRCFYVSKKQRGNQTTGNFLNSIMFLAFYLGIRAFASIFFMNRPDVLSWLYIFSHIFLGIATAYLAKFAMLNFFDLQKSKKAFLAVAMLFFTDIALNIYLPNSPHFNSELNIIEWGTNKYVGIYHTLLLWVVFLAAASLFIYKGIKNWSDLEVRWRSLVIGTAMIFSIIVVIPRNIFHEPAFILISDIGYTLTFGLALLALGYHPRIEKP
jgi:hypothetical protein